MLILTLSKTYVNLPNGGYATAAKSLGLLKPLASCKPVAESVLTWNSFQSVVTVPLVYVKCPNSTVCPAALLVEFAMVALLQIFVYCRSSVYVVVLYHALILLFAIAKIISTPCVLSCVIVAISALAITSRIFILVVVMYTSTLYLLLPSSYAAVKPLWFAVVPPLATAIKLQRMNKPLDTYSEFVNVVGVVNR